MIAQEQTVDAVAARLLAGDADAAVLYATDVAARQGQLRAIELPKDASVTVTCVACVVAATATPALARAWVKELTAPSTIAIMKQARFRPPPGAAPGRALTVGR